MTIQKLTLAVMLLAALSCFSQDNYTNEGVIDPRLTTVEPALSQFRSSSLTFTGGGAKFLRLTFTKDSLVVYDGGLQPDEAAKSFIKFIGMRYIIILDSLQREIDLYRRGANP